MSEFELNMAKMEYVSPFVLEKGFGSWSGLPVIAIGPKGGKIVGYDSKGKAIYAGSTKAKNLANTKAKAASLGLLGATKAWLVELFGSGGGITVGTAYVWLINAHADKLTEAFGVKPENFFTPPGVVFFDIQKLKPYLGHGLKPSKDKLPDLQAAEASGTTEDEWPAPSSLKEIPAGKFEGTHGNRLFQDGTGKKWLFKGKNAVIARAEEAASRLGEMLLGPGRIQKAKHVLLDGKPGALIPIEDIKPLAPAGSTVSDGNLAIYWKDIIQHHLFDWIIGQHDTHAENLQVKKDGSGLFGIDKGQAFKFIGQDELSTSYQPNEHKQVYKDFWGSAAEVELGKDAKVKAAAEILSRLAALDFDQVRAIIAPYIDEYAKKHSLGEAKELEVKILERMKDAKSNWEWFLGQTIPLTAEAAVAPAPKKKAPLKASPPKVETPVAEGTGFSPVKKGTVTLLHPGTAAKPAGWPGNYPGPGYVAKVKYKGEESTLEFQAFNGKMTILVTYPDGSQASFASPNAACDSLYLKKNGLDLNLSAKEKKKKGISYSATKMLKLKDFTAELEEHASVIPETPQHSPPVQKLTTYDALDDHGMGLVLDHSILPVVVQDFLKANKADAIIDKEMSGDWTIWSSKLDVQGQPKYYRWTVAKEKGLKPVGGVFQNLPGILEGTTLALKAAPKEAPQPKAEPIKKTPIKVSTPKSAPKDFSGPLAPGTTIKVKKKFPGLHKKKEDVTLYVLHSGNFEVELPNGETQVFKTLSSASDYVWVNQKGYANVEAYKKGTGKKKVASGGGWKFWGVKPPDTPPIVPSEVTKEVTEALEGIKPTPSEPNWEMMPPLSSEQMDKLPLGTVMTAPGLATFEMGPDGKWKNQLTGDPAPMASWAMETYANTGEAQMFLPPGAPSPGALPTLKTSPSGQWVEQNKVNFTTGFLADLPVGSEISIPHVEAHKNAIDAFKDPDGSWTMGLEDLAYAGTPSAALSAIIAAQGKGEGVYKTPATAAPTAPAAVSTITKHPDDMTPSEGAKMVSADVALHDAWEHLPEVKDNPELSFQAAGKPGHFNISILHDKSTKTPDQQIALIQKLMDTYGLKATFPTHPKTNHFSTFATIPAKAFDKHVTVQMPAKTVPPLDVKNNFETMPEVESKGKKLPKKIFKSWPLKKKLQALKSLPKGTKITLGDGLHWTKMEEGDKGLLYENELGHLKSDFALSQQIGWSGGAAITAPGKKSVLKSTPPKKTTPAIKPFVPKPPDPEKEAKKAWAKVHGPITSEASKHLSYLAQDMGLSNMEMYARMAGDGILLGDGEAAFGKELVGHGLKAFPVDTPFGILFKIPLQKLKEKTPGAKQIKGPDGVMYPHGTTFETKEVFENVQTHLQQEQGFQKFSPAKPGTGHAQAAKFVHGTDVDSIQKKYGVSGPSKHGHNYSMVLLTQAELDKDHGKPKLEVKPKTPKQPSSFKQKSLGVSHGVPNEGMAAPNNRDELGSAADIVPFRHGYSIRFGQGGILMDGQLRMHKIQMPDGTVKVRFVGELTKDTPTLNKNKKMEFLSSTTNPEPNIKGKLANDYDPETGIHKMGTKSIWNKGKPYVGGADLSQGAVVHTWDNDCESLRRTFVVDVPVDANMEQALADAMDKLGLPSDWTMDAPDEQDERIMKKIQLLRSALGPTGFKQIVNMKLLNSPKAIREEKLDQALKGQMDKNAIDGAQVVISADGRHEVEAEDLDLSKVKMVATGISAEGIARALSQGAYGGQAQTIWTGNSKSIDPSGGTTSGHSDMMGGGGFGKFFVLYNQHVDTAHGVGAAKPKLIFHPRVLKKTNWYAHSGDSYGSQTKQGETRKSALNMSSGGNEILFETLSIKDAAGALVGTQAAKTKLISTLQKEGFQDINGIPLEDFVQVGGVQSPGHSVHKFKGLQEGVLP